jgi:hypothetical protein
MLDKKVKDFIDRVLKKFEPEALTGGSKKDITDRLFLFIEKRESEFIGEYYKIIEDRITNHPNFQNTLNSAFGKRLKDDYGLKDCGVNKNPKSKLIKSYMQHC